MFISYRHHSVNSHYLSYFQFIFNMYANTVLNMYAIMVQQCIFMQISIRSEFSIIIIHVSYIHSFLITVAILETLCPAQSQISHAYI